MNRRQFLLTTAASGAAFALHAADKAKYRVAVIGHTGHGNYGHGLDTMWLQMPETEIVGVADADAAGLAGALKKLNVAKGFADYRQMLTELKPDIVSVGPRHIHEHRDMIMAAIEAGARGIYVEKPFCRTPAEADELIAAAQRRKAKIAVAHRNRYHPVLPVVAKLIEGDTIGRVLEIRARGKEDARGGSLDLWVLGSHVLNVSTFFAGKPLGCTAAVLQDGRAATKADVKQGDEGIGLLAGNEVHARFDMERGFPVFFDSIAKAGVASAGFGLQIIGTKGIINLSADKDPAAYLLAGSPFQMNKEARVWTPITTGGIGQPEPLGDVGKQVASHVIPGRDLLAAIEQDREPLCSAQDGATTVEMINAVFESHRVGGKRVALPLTSRQNPFSQLT